ncbi:TPA: hypothetical protein ACT9GI_002949, partial [Legionella pneumophila]
FILSLWSNLIEKFNETDSSSFYYNKNSFLKKAREALTLDKSQLYKLNNQYNNLYAMPVELVNKPIFEANNNNFFVLDLKSLIDSNLAITERLKRFSGKSHREFKECYYSKIAEKLFCFLIRKIFPEQATISADQDGMPDAYILEGKSLILFEFTTREPGFYRLHTGTIEEFFSEYKKFLIKTKGQSSNRGGKLYQISKHIEKLKQGKNEIYPILLTDNYIGDFDLLNNYESFLSEEIQSNSDLHILNDYPLIILCIDDLFIIWRYLEKSNRFYDLVDLLKSWANTNKGDYHYHFSRFVAMQCKSSACSDDYKEIINDMKKNLKIVD